MKILEYGRFWVFQVYGKKTEEVYECFNKLRIKLRDLFDYYVSSVPYEINLSSKPYGWQLSASYDIEIGGLFIIDINKFFEELGE